MIEYRVKRVERFIVTRYEDDPSSTSPNVRQIGKEFDQFETAYEVGYALAKADKERLGLGPGDNGVVFPSDRVEDARAANIEIFRKSEEYYRNHAMANGLPSTFPIPHD